MTVFDLFVLAIVGASVAAGALRGFVRALIASLGLVVGLILAAHFYETAGTLLRTLGVVESAEAAHAGGFLLVTGVVLLAGFVLGEFARAGLRRARLERVHRGVGPALGFVRGGALRPAGYLALTALTRRPPSPAEGPHPPAPPPRAP